MSTTDSSFVRWRLPAALLLLGAIPLGAGTLRVASLVARVPVTPDNARFFASPAPVVLHVIGAMALCALGALQVAPSFRRRKPRWHRRAGRAAAGGGIVAGLTGLWMSAFYPAVPADGAVLFGLRMFFGTAMVLSLVLGFQAARHQRFARHGVWMVRAYAIGLGAGTQALLHLPWLALFGQPGRTSRAFLMGAGWILNLAVAEWAFRSPRGSGRTDAGRPRQTCLDSRTQPAAPLP